MMRPQYDVGRRIDGKFNVWRTTGEGWFVVKVFDGEPDAKNYIRQHRLKA